MMHGLTNVKFSSIETKRETIIEEMAADVQNYAGLSNTCRYCKQRHIQALIQGLSLEAENGNESHAGCDLGL